MAKYNAELNRTFRALCDPTRRAMMETLAKGPRTVGDLGEPFRVAAPTVSKHLRVLEAAGLVRQERRGRERVCHLVEAPLREAEVWMQRYRKLWESKLDGLERYFSEKKGVKQ